MIAHADTDREGAWTFLKVLEQHLEKISRTAVREFVRDCKGSGYEFNFVNDFTLPPLAVVFQMVAIEQPLAAPRK